MEGGNPKKGADSTVRQKELNRQNPEVHKNPKSRDHLKVGRARINPFRRKRPPHTVEEKFPMVQKCRQSF